MKYAFEMGSAAVMYIPYFIKTGSGIQNLILGEFTDAQKTWRSYKPAFIFSK
jgi:hypothetical protein